MSSPLPSLEQLESLKSAIVKKRPYCSGTLRLPAENYLLFFAKGEDGHRLDFTNPDKVVLEELAQACDIATFGVNQQDTLDESYRKAGKLDSQYFAPKFDLQRSGLVGLIQDDLLEGPRASNEIRAELYKLNVYGPGSFFKAHKDTPRSEKMFGSLVLILPTPHEGGSLVLRDNGNEWTFDSAKAVNGTDGPEIGYVIFYSDVEHEVTEVKSGYRVTLTYNLYFESPTAETKHKSLHGHGQKLKEAFQNLLAETTFLPDGGNLGFGLHRQYPINLKEKSLQYLLECLKGSDATLYRVCQELGLSAQFNLVYEERDESGAVLCNTLPVELEGAYVEMNLLTLIREEHGGKMIERIDDYYDDDDSEEGGVDMEVFWVTELSKLTKVKNNYIAYGNEPSIGYIYGYGCLVVKVGPFGKRETV